LQKLHVQLIPGTTTRLPGTRHDGHLWPILGYNCIGIALGLSAYKYPPFISPTGKSSKRNPKLSHHCHFQGPQTDLNRHLGVYNRTIRTILHECTSTFVLHVPPVQVPGTGLQ